MRTLAGLDVLWRVLHAASFYLIGLAALGMLALTILSALGVLPWLALDAGFGEAGHPRAGMAAQLGVTTLLCLLAAFFPSHGRVMGLERSHRDFRVSMRDVATAYHAAHMADRAGAFTLSGEFDQVRERLTWLRDHPDLKLLEADVLTLAAQMSQQSHRLAAIYSEEKVARARDFLAQRQQEAHDQERRITEALAICGEIRRWAELVTVEEAAAKTRLAQLEEELRAAIPLLGGAWGAAWTVKEEAAEPPAAPAPAMQREGNVVPHPASMPPAE